MRYVDEPGGTGRIVWSASDLTNAAECEFAWMRGVDARLGRCERVLEPDDATRARAGALGTLHEARVLDRYRAEHGAAVREIEQASSADAAALAAAVRATREALADPSVRVIYQAAFATAEFVGFADFLVRDDEGRWLVQDTKLARRAKVSALMQLAAYVDQLDQLGVPRADTVALLLGDGTTSTHRVADVLPVFLLRRERLRALIDDRELAARATIPPIAWGDERGALEVIACGRCATCEIEVEAHRDLLLVAGMRPAQRRRLRAHGIETIEQLAAASAPPETMSADTFDSLRVQARLQLESPAPGGETPAVPAYRVVMPQALGALPRRDAGDIFFDFEGDPLYSEPPGADGAPTRWGLDYLFGWVDASGSYTALWAHSFDQERAAFETFLDIVALRRLSHPGMHIYHYAPYETAHLANMAARYGIREDEVDALLREGVFVDLYPVVRRALRVGSRSYSIKKLEPLYMGDTVRTADVQRGDDSIVQYVAAMSARERGDARGAQAMLDDLAEYNRDDCVSTLRLRDWLVARAHEAGLDPSRDVEPHEVHEPPSQRAATLLRVAAERADAVDASALGSGAGTAAGRAARARTVDAGSAGAHEARTLRLAAAAIDYYRREARTFWFAHYQRLREPRSLWEDTRDVLAVDPSASFVVDEWHVPSGARTTRRRIALRGALAPGTRLSPSEVHLIYALPAPFTPGSPVSPRWIHLARKAAIVEVLDDGAVVDESAIDGQIWDALPIAIAPGPPPPTKAQQAAIDVWADSLVQAVAPSSEGAPLRFPHDPASDILRAAAPRLRGREGGPLPRVLAKGGARDDVASIVQALRALDHSYLAVQGPPGTGKTYVGSHVIATLVREHRWKIGVVAQSHAVVEQMLGRVVAAGLDIGLVAKAPKQGASSEGAPAFTPIAKTGLAAFADAHAGTGFVVGGTAWDIANPARVPRGSLDLLVIDEAGQFSLAATIGVSLAAPRLLLLGDPQQLPQVSQGTHPEPVDTSALAWVMRGHDVIPAESGYFLERSWRMHPLVANAVSALSYDGQLRAHPAAASRALEGIEPGVHAHPVAHRGNTTASPEEAAVVVELVRGLIGRAWRDVRTDAEGTVPVPERALTASDIIVVTPYNAQQLEVEQALAAAGFAEVPVGTVDLFQGREAVCAIVSLAASSGRDAPRGLEFLLLQNRLNVAISRAQWAATIVYSPALLSELPHTPEGVARLAAFARLVAGRRAGFAPTA